MKKYRFLFFAHAYPDLSANTQNLYRLTHNLIKYTIDNDLKNEVFIVSANSSYNQEFENYYSQTTIIHQYRYWLKYNRGILRTFNYRIFIPIWLMIQSIKQALQAKESGMIPIYVCTTNFRKYTHIVSFWGKLVGAKIIQMRTEKPRELSFCMRETVCDKIRRRWRIMQFQNTYGNIDGFIAETDTLARYYKTLTSSRVPIVIIPTFIDPNNVIITASIQSPITRNKIITYAGGLAASKRDGVTFLIQAAKWINNPDVKIRIIGKIIDEHFYQQLQELAAESLQTKVEFMPNLNRAGYTKALAESDVLVLYKERDYYTNAGMSSKLIEYLQTSKPVIITKYVNTYPMKLYDGQNAFMVKHEDAKALAQTIKQVLTANNCGEIGRNGFNELMKSLCPTKYLHDFYTEIEAIK